MAKKAKMPDEEFFEEASKMMDCNPSLEKLREILRESTRNIQITEELLSDVFEEKSAGRSGWELNDDEKQAIRA